MSSKPRYTATPESITVVWEGKPYTVKKGAPNFPGLQKAIKDEEWDDIPNHLSVAKSVETWSDEQFKIEGEKVTHKGEEIPQEINDRIIEMTSKGEDPISMLNFWKRLKKNPSKRSVDQLWPFLKHRGIPLTPDGCFLAYKGVRNDYRDAHSGTFINKPGAVLEIPRNVVSDDPRQACHEGFHVGAYGYASGFSQRVVVVKVDPKDVVCIPYDSSQQKMRVCKYEVLGNHNGDLLPSTAFHDDDINEEGQKKFDEGVDHDAPPEPDEPLVLKKEKKESKAKGKVTRPPTKRKAHKFDKLDSVDLMERSLDELRNYATYGLMITGASKIHGGKTALVSRILKVRSGEEE